MRTKSKVQSLKSKVRSPEASDPGSRFRVRPPSAVSLRRTGGSGLKVRRSAAQRPAAPDYLARFLCAGFALAVLLSGCAGPRPLKGGKAVTTRKPTGIVEQTLVQSENPAAASKQNQESVKVRTYTVPAGSTLNAECGIRNAEWRISHADSGERSAGGRKTQAVSADPQQSTINSQPINLPQPSTISYPPHRHGQLSGIVAASAAEQTKPSNQQPATSNQ